MRRFLGIVWLAGFWAASVSAQDPAEEPGTDEVEAIETEVVETEVIEQPEGEGPVAPTEAEEPPALRGPTFEGLELPPPVTVETEDEELGAEKEGGEDLDAEDADLLGEAEPPPSDPTLAVWSDPRPVFSINGYFRVRGNLWDNFALGREPQDNPGQPFSQFIPADAGLTPQGGCDGPYTSSGEVPSCPEGSDQTRFADMRLRLQPTISVSDDIRVHMMFDAFDNMVLGSTPDVKAVNAEGDITGRAPGADVDSLTRTLNPPQIGRNTVSDVLIVRRAWAEVGNRAIGQLRFGRMGHQWGLGMLWNSGERIDDDFTTEIDRVQAMAKVAGIFMGASWDFPSKGFILDQPGDVQGIPFDGTAKDDARQWSFLLARRMEPLEQERRLRSGKWVVNGGAYFIYRKQFLSSSTAPLVLTSPDDFETYLVRRDARVYMPDGWFQALWKDLRLELEFAYIAGKITNVGTTTTDTVDGESDDPNRFKLRQWGIAFEGEYRTLKKKLGVHLKTGFASGDPGVSGLSNRENLLSQPRGSDTISTFSFNPNYRVDLILFRRILGTVSGAYYLAPGMSYDILRTDFGNVFGGRFDFIYSRAQYRAQSYGENPNLGSELDLQVYYRTGDGPSFLDGYYTAFQYGILFPLKGMKFPPNADEDLNAGRAWTLRLIMAVQF